MALFDILLSLTSMISIGAHAASPSLNLNDALVQGRTHSPRLQQALSQSREMGWKKTETFGGFLPQVSVSASHFFTYQYQFVSLALGGSPVTFPLTYPLTSASFDVKLPVFDGFRNVFNYQAASLAAEAAEEQTSWVQFSLEQDIRDKFYQALAAQKLSVVADQNLKTLEDHIRKIKIRRSGGVATRFDVLRVEVQLDEAQSDKISSDDNVTVALQKLFEDLGFDRVDREIEGELPVPDLKLVSRFPEGPPGEYLSSRHDVVALARKVDENDRRQTAAAAFWVPQVYMGYDYTYYNNVDTTLSTPFGSAYSLGVFISWNIFDGAVSFARHKEAAEETRSAELNLRSAQLKFKTDYTYWRKQYIYNTKLYEAKLADVDKAQEAVRLADEGYKAGIRTTSEVLDAELDLFRARAGAVKAQLSAAEALLNLELSIGRKI